jgi:arabinofuranosyltransferase
MTAAGLLLTLHPTLAANVEYGLAINSISKAPWDERGVDDERAFYVGNSALLRAHRGGHIPNDERKKQGQAIAANQVWSTGSPLGVSSFFAPPTAIILDGYGLTDALIARLPALDKKNWRVGHYWRDVPAGYGDSISQERNLIADENVARLYDRVKLVVSGPIWSWERWKEIVRLNFGLKTQ